MERHHFKVILLPAAILDVRCVDADYKGPDTDYFNERDVELGATVLANRKILGREIEFSLSDSSDSFELLYDTSYECALEPHLIAQLCLSMTDVEPAADVTDESKPATRA